MTNIWKTEPAVVTSVVTGVIDAGIILAVTFGAPITATQKTAIDGFISAALALVGLVVSGVVTRSQVSPVAAGTAPVSPAPIQPAPVAPVAPQPAPAEPPKPVPPAA